MSVVLVGVRPESEHPLEVHQLITRGGDGKGIASCVDTRREGACLVACTESVTGDDPRARFAGEHIGVAGMEPAAFGGQHVGGDHFGQQGVAEAVDGAVLVGLEQPGVGSLLQRRRDLPFLAVGNGEENVVLDALPGERRHLEEIPRFAGETIDAMEEEIGQFSRCDDVRTIGTDGEQLFGEERVPAASIGDAAHRDAGRTGALQTRHQVAEVVDGERLEVDALHDRKPGQLAE